MNKRRKATQEEARRWSGMRLILLGAFSPGHGVIFDDVTCMMYVCMYACVMYV